MKKFICIIVNCIIIVVLFGGCDPYANKKPYNYDNTKWVSTDPNLFFEVADKYYDLIGTSTYGVLTINGKQIEMIVHFAPGNVVVFDDIASYVPAQSGLDNAYSRANIVLFWGEAKFSWDKMILDIKEDKANLIPDDVTQITFVREPLS